QCRLSVGSTLRTEAALRQRELDCREFPTGRIEPVLIE
ncbi:MAG: hypothetical protein ACI93T_001698, partial [Porticoccaceae bacterium]